MSSGNVLGKSQGLDPGCPLPLVHFLNELGLDKLEFLGPNGRLDPNDHASAIDGNGPRGRSDFLTNDSGPFMRHPETKIGMTERGLAIF